MDRLLRDYRLIARSPLSVDGAAVRAALRHRCIWSREPPILLSTIPWLWTDGRVQVARTERYVHSLGDFYRAASEGRLGFGEKTTATSITALAKAAYRFPTAVGPWALLHGMEARRLEVNVPYVMLGENLELTQSPVPLRCVVRPRFFLFRRSNGKPKRARPRNHG